MRELSGLVEGMTGELLGEVEHVLGDKKIAVKNGLVRLEDGTISVSALTLINAVKNYIEFTGATLIDVVRTVTANSVRLLGMESEIGTMEVGTKADLTAFDHKFQVQFTMVDGEIVYRCEGRMRNN